MSFSCSTDYVSPLVFIHDVVPEWPEVITCVKLASRYIKTGGMGQGVLVGGTWGLIEGLKCKQENLELT